MLRGLFRTARNMHVADLTRSPICTVDQLAIGEYASGNPGSNSKKYEIADALRGAPPVLSDGCHSYIVFNRGRNA